MFWEIKLFIKNSKENPLKLHNRLKSIAFLTLGKHILKFSDYCLFLLKFPSIFQNHALRKFPCGNNIP